MQDPKLDYRCSGCALHCLDCICEHPTYPPDPCESCEDKKSAFQGKVKCHYCDNPAEKNVAVCMINPCLRTNFQRLLYYEALKWTSPELPNEKPPERFREKKPWWRRLLRK